MALNYILKDIKTMLVNQGFTADDIVISTVIEQPTDDTSLQNAIFLIPESTQANVSNYQTFDFALYLRRADVETANTDSRTIFEYLNGKRGNIGLVSAGYAKILWIEVKAQPYTYSVRTTGGNLTEIAMKFTINYINTDFDNI